MPRTPKLEIQDDELAHSQAPQEIMHLGVLRDFAVDVKLAGDFPEGILLSPSRLGLEESG